MSDFKAESKPHLTFSNGCWGVWYPVLLDIESEEVKEIMLWLVRINNPYRRI